MNPQQFEIFENQVYQMSNEKLFNSTFNYELCKFTRNLRTHMIMISNQSLSNTFDENKLIFQCGLFPHSA